jgi:hypothetical protein
MVAANVMIDLETLGNVPGSTILSIGAIGFGPDGFEPMRAIYLAINRKSCKDAGLIEDPETVAWWNDQSEEAKRALREADSIRTSLSVGRALNDFSKWLNKQFSNSLLLWGNGSFYDLGILEAARIKTGHYPIWPKHADRCYRTLKNLRKDIVFEPSGIKHDALDDAIAQAQHATKILNAIGGWE